MFKLLSPRALIDGNSGMTLIEIMIVLAILGSMTGLIVQKVINAADQAKVRQTKIKLQELQQSINLYENDCGAYPETIGNLSNKTEDCPNWGPKAYASKDGLKDLWGHPISYEIQDGKFILKSFGKDGRPGGTDINSDIILEEQE